MKPNKDAFIAEISKIIPGERKQIAVDLLELCDKKLKTSLPNRWRKEYGWIKGKYMRSGKISKIQMFKLYVLAYSDKFELDHWQITGSQCFRTAIPSDYKYKWLNKKIQRDQAATLRKML